MILDLTPDEQAQQSVVPSALVRPFKSFMRTPAYIKHRRLRRSDYFVAMSDSCACIPPGTPMSSTSHRTEATTDSNDTGSPVKHNGEENESVVSQLDKATESVSDAGACGTSSSWSLLSLPTMQKANHIVQFTPSQDVSADEDILYDILLCGTGTTSKINHTTQLATLSNVEGGKDHQKQRLLMRPLTANDESSIHNLKVECEIDDCTSGLEYNVNAKCVPGSDDVIPDLILSQEGDDYVIPEVPIIRSLLYPPSSLQALHLEVSPVPKVHDINIPKEIICYPDKMEAEGETNDDFDHQVHDITNTGGTGSSPCILPCPKDQPFRRRHRRLSDPKVTLRDASSSDVSFMDIICRHQQESIPQSDEEHSIPMIIIEVDRRRQNELPPKDNRRRHRSRARKDYQRRWQRRNGGRPRIDYAPEYASV